MREDELDTEVATTLDLDSIIGARVGSTTAGMEAREVMGITVQEEQVT